jgi:hypothetical protein
MDQLFGKNFTATLLEGSRNLGIDPAWILAVIALESGFNPFAANPSGARGLWQKMPEKKVLYDVGKSPAVQLGDAIHFWQFMQKTFQAGPFKSRAAFYCLNLAPARLKGGTYTGETVLYAGDIAYKQNRWLDINKDGKITIDELEPCLARAVVAHQTKFDAELETALAENLISDVGV